MSNQIKFDAQTKKEKKNCHGYQLSRVLLPHFDNTVKALVSLNPSSNNFGTKKLIINVIKHYVKRVTFLFIA